MQALADQLAFAIAFDFPDSGMTNSPVAFSLFTSGINHAKLFESTHAHSQLRQAIACFTSAIKIDSSFPDAHYHLAAAFEQDHQPLRASEALKSVNEGHPFSVKAMMRQADLLYNADSYHQVLEWALFPPVTPQRPMQRIRALQLWTDIAYREPAATDLELSAAFLGMCEVLFDQVTSSTATATDNVDLLYLPYYFCKRAEGYSSRSADINDGPERQNLHASIANQLAVVLVSHNLLVRPMEQLRTLDDVWSNPLGSLFNRISRLVGTQNAAPRSWIANSAVSELFCNANAIDVSQLHSTASIHLLAWSSPMEAYALPYFEFGEQARITEVNYKCNYATFALSRGEMQAMSALVRNSEQRLTLARDLADIAHEYAYQVRQDTLDPTPDRSKELSWLYYQMAYDNYEAARDIDGTSLELSDAAAYCVFSWEVDSRLRGMTLPSERVHLSELVLRD